MQGDDIRSDILGCLDFCAREFPPKPLEAISLAGALLGFLSEKFPEPMMVRLCDLEAWRGNCGI